MELPHILGNVPVIRIINFFVEYTEMDYTKSDIKECAEIKQADMVRDFPNLLGSGVIIETRRIRGEALYKLNRVNPITKAIITFKDAIAGDVLVSPEELRATMQVDEQLDTWVPKHDPHASSDMGAEQSDSYQPGSVGEAEQGVGDELGACQLEAAQQDFEASEPAQIPVEPESVGPTGAI